MYVVEINRRLQEREKEMLEKSEQVIKSGKRKGICPKCSTENIKPFLQKYSSCRNCNQDSRWR